MTADGLSHVTEQLDGLDPIAMLRRALRQYPMTKSVTKQ